MNVGISANEMKPDIQREVLKYDVMHVLPIKKIVYRVSRMVISRGWEGGCEEVFIYLLMGTN